MSESFLAKQQKVKDFFSPLSTLEAKYLKIIEIGKNAPQLSKEFHTEENRVEGCQSTMYLTAFFKDGSLYFEAFSEALISKGLAELLIMVYSGEKPEAVLTEPPHYLDELNIAASLTPGRANGLYNIHLAMKKEALKHLVNTSNNN